MLDAEATAIDPELLQFQSAKNRAASSGSRGIVLSESRGRYVRPFPADRFAVLRSTPHSAQPPLPKGSTRARTPPQGDRSRRRSAREATATQSRRPGDLPGGCQRLDGAEPHAKRQGAVLRLLTEAYENRDEVALIPFRGEQAEVLLPPTRSITAAKRRLETMACGGDSPGPWPCPSGAGREQRLANRRVIASGGGRHHGRPRQCAARPLIGTTRN